MYISDESLILLKSVIINNPKHSPLVHWNDYARWIEFAISNYKNKEFLESEELHDYLINNGFCNFEDEVEDMVYYYHTIIEFINYLDNVKYKGIIPNNVQWLINRLNS